MLMQVLDDTGKVLRNIVMESDASIHTENSALFPKKADRGEARGRTLESL
jgi:hypothetical protein